jgi:hypothetical protein
MTLTTLYQRLRAHGLQPERWSLNMIVACHAVLAD